VVGNASGEQDLSKQWEWAEMDRRVDEMRTGCQNTDRLVGRQDADWHSILGLPSQHEIVVLSGVFSFLSLSSGHRVLFSLPAVPVDSIPAW
jgi:hypothetical protein